MEIQIDERYWLTADPRNWMLAERQKSGKEEGRLIPFSFHTTLSGAFKSYIKLKARTSDAGSFAELTEVIQGSYASVDACMREISGRLDVDTRRALRRVSGPQI